MNMNQKRGFVLKIVMVVATAALIAACGGHSDEEKAAAEQAAKAKKVVKKIQPIDPLAAMSVAITGTKGTLPLEVHFELLDRPEPNNPVNIRLAFVPSIDLLGLRAAIKPMPGL